MGLLTKSIPGFYNGLSQQPASLRLATQVEAQENIMNSLVHGSYKRPNTDWVAYCGGESNVDIDSFRHIIKRDMTEHYFVFVTSDTTNPLEVYTLDGTRCEIRYGALDEDLVYSSDTTVIDYLRGTGTPRTRLRACTVADYTFITNSTITPAYSDELSSGTLVKTVQTTKELPAVGGDADYGTPVVNGIYKVQGDENNDYVGYYLKYGSDAVYTESILPGIKYKLNASTMPHRLVRTGVNQFTFAPCIWEDMKVGDKDVNPDPTFIGDPIKNIFYYKTRLGFLTQQNIIMSKFSTFFDFYPDTVIDVLDTDPIDISAGSDNNVVNLIDVATFKDSLIVFSKEKQFALTTNGDPLTSTSAVLTPTTSYEVTDSFKPQMMGSNVYFPTPKTKNISLMEYFVNADSLVTEAADVSAHCPNLIPNGILNMNSCLVMDMIFLHSSVDTNSLYTYKFYWNGDKKMQSAWCKWTFTDEILNYTCIESVIWFLFREASTDKLYIAKMELDTIEFTDGRPFRIHLDKLAKMSGTYNSTLNETTWISPYPTTNSSLVNLSSGMEVVEGVKADDGYSWSVTDDYSSEEMFTGIPYSSYFTLSKFYLKNGDGVAITDAKYQIRSVVIVFTDTGGFEVQVDSEGRSPLIHSYTGVILGSAVLGVVNLVSDEKRFMVMGNTKTTSITIRNDSHLPSAFQSASMEIFFVSRGQAR